MSSTNLLGNRLVQANIITEEELEEALDLQESIGGRLGSILLKLSLVGPEALASALADMCQVPVMHPSDIYIDHSLIKSFDQRLMERLSFFPVLTTEHTIKIAAADPSDVEIVNRIEFETEKTVELVAMNSDEISQVLSEVFAPAPVKYTSADHKAPLSEDEERVQARERLHHSSFREVLFALVDDLESKGLIEYKEILNNLGKG